MTVPNTWISIHRPVLCAVDNYTVNFTAVSDVSGKARFHFVGLPSAIPISGENKIYIASGTYKGFHEVTATTNSTITTNTTFGATASGTIEVQFDYTMQIVGGYPLLDETIGFKVYYDTTGQISFQIQAYLKAISNFETIQPPTFGTYDPNMFCHYRVELVPGTDLTTFITALYGSVTDANITLVMGWDNSATYYALNGTFKQTALQAYDAEGTWLDDMEPRLFSNCGCFLSSQIVDDVVMNIKSCNQFGIAPEEMDALMQDGGRLLAQDGFTVIRWQ